MKPENVATGSATIKQITSDSKGVTVILEFNNDGEKYNKTAFSSNPDDAWIPTVVKQELENIQIFKDFAATLTVEETIGA